MIFDYQKAYSAAWYRRNRKKKLKQAQDNYFANHEEILAKRAKFREENREEINRRARERYHARKAERLKKLKGAG